MTTTSEQLFSHVTDTIHERGAKKVHSTKTTTQMRWVILQYPKHATMH